MSSHDISLRDIVGEGPFLVNGCVGMECFVRRAFRNKTFETGAERGFRGKGASDCVTEFNLKTRGHAVKRFAVDAEDFCCPFSVIASGVENVKYVAPFNFVEIRQARKEFGEIVCREWRRVV